MPTALLCTQAEEEEFAVRLMHYFNSGLLGGESARASGSCSAAPPEGSTLRAFLSDRLQCNPMRITKKLRGYPGMGKRLYRQAEGASSAAVPAARTELELLEERMTAQLYTRASNRKDSNKSGGSKKSLSSYSPVEGTGTFVSDSDSDEIPMVLRANDGGSRGAGSSELSPHVAGSLFAPQDQGRASKKQQSLHASVRSTRAEKRPRLSLANNMSLRQQQQLSSAGVSASYLPVATRSPPPPRHNRNQQKILWPREQSKPHSGDGIALDLAVLSPLCGGESGENVGGGGAGDGGHARFLRATGTTTAEFPNTLHDPQPGARMTPIVGSATITACATDGDAFEPLVMPTYCDIYSLQQTQPQPQQLQHFIGTEVMEELSLFHEWNPNFLGHVGAGAGDSGGGNADGEGGKVWSGALFLPSTKTIPDDPDCLNAAAAALGSQPDMECYSNSWPGVSYAVDTAILADTPAPAAPATDKPVDGDAAARVTAAYLNSMFMHCTPQPSLGSYLAATGRGMAEEDKGSYHDDNQTALLPGSLRSGVYPHQFHPRGLATQLAMHGGSDASGGGGAHHDVGNAGSGGGTHHMEHARVGRIGAVLPRQVLPLSAVPVSGRQLRDRDVGCSSNGSEGGPPGLHTALGTATALTVPNQQQQSSSHCESSPLQPGGSPRSGGMTTLRVMERPEEAKGLTPPPKSLGWVDSMKWAEGVGGLVVPTAENRVIEGTVDTEAVTKVMTLEMEGPQVRPRAIRSSPISVAPFPVRNAVCECLSPSFPTA